MSPTPYWDARLSLGGWGRKSGDEIYIVELDEVPVPAAGQKQVKIVTKKPAAEVKRESTVKFLAQKILPGVFTVCAVSFMIFLLPWFLFMTVHGEICHSRECQVAGALFQRTMNTEVDPCDDFYQFACGNWNLSSSRLSYVDHTTIIRQRILETLRELTEEIGTKSGETDEQETEPVSIIQMKIFYDSCVKHEGLLSRVDSLESVISSLIEANNSLGTTLGRIRRLTGQSFIVKLSIGPDFKNPRTNRIFIERPELALPKRVLLSSGSIGDGYGQLVYSSLFQVWPILYSEVPIKEINETVRQILEIEGDLAQAMSIDDDDKTKPEMFNLISLKQINDLFLKRQELEDPQLESNVTKTQVKLNWTEYVSNVFANTIAVNITEETTVDVKDLQYLRKLAAVISRTSVPRLKNYLRWQLLNTFGNNFLQDQQQHQVHQADGKASDTEAPIYMDKQQIVQRQLECIQLMDTLIPFALSYKFVVENVTKPSVISGAETILRDIVSSFQGVVARYSWMEPGTKLKAIQKAGMVRAFLGYPKWLRNATALDAYFDGLVFHHGDFLRNLLTALEWISRKELTSYSQPVDTQWSGTGDSPLEVDAFYDDELNSITIPLGFLQQPFIGMGLRSLDYGALGFFIGHELTHGFDTEGRYSDEQGRLSSWWTPKTLENFNRKTRCFQEQYSRFHIPEINAKVNGKQTLKENIADNGGLEQAFRAYQLFIERHGPETLSLPGIEQYSSDQLFFLAFAQSWCSYVSEPTLRDMVQFNEHSPPKFRVIGSLSNLRNFSTVWNCPVGSRMNPRNKCLLW